MNDILASLAIFFGSTRKMMSIKLFRGAVGLNQSIASARTNANYDNNNINTIPRLATLHDEEASKPHMIHQIGSRHHLSTGHCAKQAAPLLTLRAPKISSSLQDARIDLPPKPKKPLTAWLAFLRDRKDEHLKDGPMKASQLTMMLSKEWQAIDKSRYEREYRERQEVYRYAMESYERSLTDEQRAVIKAEKNLKRETRAMKALRNTKPPILPRNSANLYCIERCKDPEIKEQLKIKHSGMVLKDLFAEYRNLTESERERYLELQHKDRARFQQEFNQWYSKIQSDSSLSKTAREKANLLYARFKALNWI